MQLNDVQHSVQCIRRELPRAIYETRNTCFRITWNLKKNPRRCRETKEGFTNQLNDVDDDVAWRKKRLEIWLVDDDVKLRLLATTTAPASDVLLLQWNCCSHVYFSHRQRRHAAVTVVVAVVVVIRINRSVVDRPKWYFALIKKQEIWTNARETRDAECLGLSPDQNALF